MMKVMGDPYEFWKTRTYLTAADAICTGAKDINDLHPSDYLIDLCGEGTRALDFGCGAGRNTYTLAERFTSVVAFDFPNMVSIVNRSPYPNIIATSVWELVKQHAPYDAVLASLVFQHLVASDLDRYIDEIAEMTQILVIASRSWLDHEGGEIWPHITRRFSPWDVIFPEGDHFYGAFKPIPRT